MISFLFPLLGFSFADTVSKGFNKVIGGIGSFFSGMVKMLGSGLSTLIDLLTKPLKLLFWFLDGIFYFVSQLFQIAILIVKIIVALFQFGSALIKGIFKTIDYWFHFQPSGDVSFPSVSQRGFAVVIDLLNGTGLMTVVPLVATAFVVFFTVIKMLAFWGGNITVAPFGSSNGK